MIPNKLFISLFKCIILVSLLFILYTLRRRIEAAKRHYAFFSFILLIIKFAIFSQIITYKFELLII